MDLMNTTIGSEITGGITSSSSSGRSDSDGGDGVWIVVDDGDLKGMTMVTDRQTGDVICLSSKNCSNEDKRRDMPSLDEYPELKVVDFHGQRYMKCINESIGVPAKMERLILSRMDSLTTLHPAVGNLHNLVELDLFDSFNISELPDDISGLRSLKRLRMGGSSGVANKSLERLPESLGDLVSLEELYLDKLKTLKALPSSIGKLQNLVRLFLRECKSIRILPPSIVRCQSLVELNLLKCQSLQSLPADIGRMSALEELVLHKAKSVTEIPPSIGGLDHLSVLDLRSMTITRLPEELSACVQLQILDLSDCSNLAELPPLVGELPKIHVRLTNTPSLKSIPPSFAKFI
mmetsp:Transcript_61089/g.149566  ORF Transcript_61089/g.149566 Transcript_61089/m.149566 type:complete len:348 (-) Transcript_61089:289-1332(-)